jgi:class 3 adenylate cyclase
VKRAEGGPPRHDVAVSGGPEQRHTATVSVLFCDLVGSTERQVRMGDDASDEFRRRYFTALREAVARSGGQEVKNTGDGLMVVFRHSALDAVSCAVAMHESVAVLDVDDPVQIYVGISAGEAAQDDGDWFGTPVNEAARLCAAAKPGQTLTNEVVRSLVGSRGSFAFRSIGSLNLKGLPTPVACVEVITPEPVSVPSVQPESRPRRPGRGVMIALIASALLVIGVAVGVVLLADGAKHVTSVAAGGSIGWHDDPVYRPARCDPALARQIPGLTCGRLIVPENRDRPNGRTVSIAVTRAPARNGAHGDPVLDFGADDLATSPARDYADEIQLQGRGSDLTCPEYEKVGAADLTLPSNDLGVRERESAAIHACYERWAKRGVDLNQYNLIVGADDMVDLIRALHLPQVNLVSGYIASIAALEVIRQLPNTVRTLTLQEPVAPGNSAWSDPTAELAGAFNSYVSLCDADAACKSSFPDLPAAVKHTFDVYRRAPRLVFGDDGQGHTHEVLLDGPRADQALAAALSNRHTYSVLAAGIAAPNRTGILDTLTAGQVVAWNVSVLDPTNAWGDTLSESCSYDRYTIAAGHVLSSRTLPAFSGIDNGFLDWACKAWPVKKAPDRAFDNPSSTVPTLIVNPGFGATFDPTWINDFQAGLANTTVATFPTIDINVLRDNVPACIGDLRRAFLTTPTTPLNIAGCERQSPKIQFVATVGS